MKARRQIVDPLTGAKVPASSPVAVDTGNLIVGRDTVVPDEARDPAADRFGITPSAAEYLREEIAGSATRKRMAKSRGRGPAIRTTMESPAAGAREFEALNPQIFEAPGFDDVDIHDRARDFLQDVEVKRGKKHVPLGKTKVGKEILGARSGGAIARGVLRQLFAQAPGGRWRSVPWPSVLEFTGEIVDALGDAGPSDASVLVPIAAGLEPPDVILARAREELGDAAAAKIAREMNRDELRALADRYHAAIERQGEECLSGDALRIARGREATLRRWAKSPELVPDWSCVGTIETEGEACSYLGLLEDIRRLERSCDTDYDPQWPVERAEAACAERAEEGRTGLLGKPCAIERPSARVPRIVRGRIVR